MNRAIVDRIEIAPDATVQVRISKQVVAGGFVTSQSWHRTAFTPGCDVEGTMRSVDAHLSEMGYGAVSQTEWAKVRAVISAEHTSEVVQAHAARQSAGGRHQ